MIQSAVRTSSSKKLPGKNPYDLPQAFHDEIAAKNRLRREWQKFRDPATKRRLNEKTAFIRLLIQTHKQDEYDRFLNSLDTSDNSIYRLNRQLLKKPPAIHPLVGPTGPVYSAAEKAELLADNFQRQFSPNPGPDLQEVNSSIEIIRHTITKNPFHISPGQLAYAIGKLRNRKAPGEDKISNTVLKQFPPKVIILLTNIFNICLRLGYFPSAWKTGMLITIPKVGKDHNIPANYRPITLQTSLSKLFERFIAKFLLTAIGSKIRQEQFAFRKDHSTTQQLVKLIDQLTINANNKLKTAAMFIDVEKASIEYGTRVYFTNCWFSIHQYN